MGLDMYLTKRHYVKNWEHTPKEFRHTITVKRGGKKYDLIKPERVSYLTEDVAYWRKANAIHTWFVENVQEGVDDCKEYQVSRKDLQTLVDTCKTVLDASKLVTGQVVQSYTHRDGKEVPNYVEGKVIADPSVADKLLPSKSGFFFGSTEYDEYYYRDILYTYTALKALLEEGGKDDRGYFYYHSSW